MKSAIEEIYGGTFASKPQFDKEYWEAIAVAAKKEEAILQFIKDNAEAVKTFEEYQNAEGEILCMEVCGFYKTGFRNGFQIALDAIKDE